MTDTMRLQPRKLTDEDLLALDAVKTAGNEFVEILKKYTHPGRELSIALTNAEQSVMWAVKGITG